MYYRVVDRETMRKMDQDACLQQNITNLQLMERVGLIVYDYLNTHILSDLNQKILVLVGPGNNGGDALVIARILLENHFNVQVILVGNRSNCSLENTYMLSLLQSEASIVNDYNHIALLDNEVKNADIIIDGIFGIGLTKKITGIIETVINKVNASKTQCISIDIASGIDADNGLVLGCAVHANINLAIAFYKVGHFINQGKDYHENNVCIDVLIPPVNNGEIGYLIDESMLDLNQLKRLHDSHKYSYGSVVIFGGSKEMMGAALLSAHAALRSGSGIVSIALRVEDRPFYTLYMPEIICLDYQNEKDLKAILEKKKAIVYGVGLGKEKYFDPIILETLIDSGIPIIIDGDGIHHYKMINHKYQNRKNIILTPHFGEFSTLHNVDSAEIKREVLNYVKRFMSNFDGVLVLKGPTTLICYQNEIAYMIEGTPSLACAGSGDVLSGIISALLAQGISYNDSAKSGCLLHALAGKQAKKHYGEISVIASDIIHEIPNLIKTHMISM